MATFLADKSALTRRDTRPEVREVLEPLLLTGQRTQWIVPRGSVA